ncbi:mCG145461, partial [Mus musculus]
ANTIHLEKDEKLHTSHLTSQLLLPTFLFLQNHPPPFLLQKTSGLSEMTARLVKTIYSKTRNLVDGCDP